MSDPLKKIDDNQPKQPISGSDNGIQTNVVPPEVTDQTSRTVVVGNVEGLKLANKVPDKTIDSRQVVVSAVDDNKSKVIQDVRKVSRSERLEEIRKCAAVVSKIIIGAVALVFVGAALVSVVKNADNIFHAIDGTFEAVTTALANISGRLTNQQSVQQSDVIGGVINEIKSMVCSDYKDATMLLLQSAGGKLCKNVDLSKLCEVAKKASTLNEKFGINSYDQNALAGLKIQLLQCVTKKKPNSSECSEYLGILNGIKNVYFANECLEAVAANEIGNVTKLLDDKDLVKNSLLYELITKASNIAGFFSQTKNVILGVLIVVGIPAVGLFSKTFANVIKTCYNFFKGGAV